MQAEPIRFEDCPQHFQTLIEKTASYFRADGMNVTTQMFRFTSEPYAGGSSKYNARLDLSAAAVFSTAYPEADTLFIYAIDEYFKLSIIQERNYLLSRDGNFTLVRKGQSFGPPAVYSLKDGVLDAILTTMFPHDPESPRRYEQMQIEQTQRETDAVNAREKIRIAVEQWAASAVPQLAAGLQEIDGFDLIGKPEVASLVKRAFETKINALFLQHGLQSQLNSILIRMENLQQT